MPTKAQGTADAPSPSGAFVDSIRFFEQPNQAQALLDLESGSMDLYTFPLRTAADVEAARDNPALRTDDVYGQEANLFANPVPVNQNLAPGVFNPFELRDVRKALNYLVDGEYLNELLFGGYGSSHAALWNDASPEVARDPFLFRDLNGDAAYNFTRAKDLVFDALNESGATYDGTWSWQGNPVVVTFVIRTEDARLQMGDYVADQLERLGLTVDRLYRSGAAAFAIVYNGPPDVGAWMLYTEGWASARIEAWADADPDFFYCGGEGSAIWSVYVPPPDLAGVCTSLKDGEYATAGEREALVERAVTLGLDDSVRVWIVADATFAYSARITGFVSDTVAGLWGPLAIRTARFASPGGTLQVGQRLHMLSPWQPWRGFGWIYDLVASRTFADPALTIHPHSGAYIGLRTDFETTTAGPTGSIDVPSDAQEWDSSTLGFKDVGLGTTAKSFVNYTFTFGTWHDGSNFTMDDVRYELALLFRRADPAGDVYAKDDDAASTASILLRDAFRGFKVVDASLLQVWYDYWHLDPTRIASLINPAFPSTPWTASELALSTVLDDTCRISEVTAAIEGREALDITKGACRDRMDVNLPGMLSHLPPGLDFDPIDAESRWADISSFRTTYGHFYAGNGPFVLSNVDVITAEATAIAFADYPFPADHWDSLLSIQVPDLAIEPISDVVIGEAGHVSLTTTLSGAPYDNATIRYRVSAQGNRTPLLEGLASFIGAGDWQVDLDPSFTSTLDPGTHVFEAAAVGNETTVVVFADRNFVASEPSPPPQDTTAPTSSLSPLPAYWQTSGPFLLEAIASDDLSGVASVDLYAAFSSDGAAWSPPTLVAMDDGEPFAFDYAPSQGDGRYRFWTLATDGAGNSETLAGKPATGEVETGLDGVGPASQLSGPVGYWQRTVPIALAVDASDATSGVASVELYVSYSADGTTWSVRSLSATDSGPPFNFALGLNDGRYRFWTVATDAAGNEESIDTKPTTGELEVGLDRTAPTVLTASPPDGASNVPTAGLTVRVTFSEAVDHASAEAAFSIVPSVAGTFSWDGNTLVFTPAGAIASDTSYEVTIDAADVTDIAGNTLTSDYVISFATRSPQTAGPLEPLGLVVTVGVASSVVAVAVLIVWAVRGRGKHG